MRVIRARPGHEVILANYFAMNECHFQIWNPVVPAGHHSIDCWKNRLDERELEFDEGVSAHFIGTDETESCVVGSCSLSNIVRGVFQSCHMDYSMASCSQSHLLLISTRLCPAAKVITSARK